MNSFLKEVEDTYEDLPESQKRVAKYIINNYEHVAFITLEDLSDEIGVSTTTVIRFARSLGYNGFSNLQEQIRQIVRAKISLPERLDNLANEVEHDEYLLKSFNNDIDNINNTLELLNKDKIEQTVEQIIKANTVFSIGLRSSFSLAYFFTTTLGQIRENVRLLFSIGAIQPEEEILNAKPGDVCVAFSFPRYTKLTIEIAKCLKERGVIIIGISDNALSPISEVADIVLPCKVKGMMFKNSLSAPFSLINYLISVISIKDKKRAMEMLSKNEEICRRYEYFSI
ncbi:MAG: MurR/RpiR family transcriptional regulator [Bacillota bacterium]